MIEFKNHAFKGLDEDFTAMYDMTAQMAGLINDQLDMIEAALADKIHDNAKAKIADKKINALEIDIESHIANVFSKYSLAGNELRFVMSMLKLSATLENIGDMSKNCVKRTVKLKHPIQPDFISKATALKGVISNMLSTSMDLVQKYDANKAAMLQEQEDEADRLYKETRVSLERTSGDNLNARDSTHMLFIIKNMERMADLTIDIMKICYYIHNGTKLKKVAEG